MFDDITSQRVALSKLPDKRFIQTSAQVKGPYTSGGYVIWQLNSIFGPDNWRHTLVHGPEIVRLSDSQAYVQVTVRIDAQFANGNQVAHEDVGVWPLAATNAKAGGTLDDTAPERYETVLKACVTDGLKACAEYFGVCFRPLADQALAAAIAGHGAGSSVSGSSIPGSSTFNSANGRQPVERKPVPAPAEPAAPPSPAPAQSAGDVPWCEWCGNAPSLPGVPCRSCQALGATEDNKPAFRAKPKANGTATGPTGPAKPAASAAAPHTGATGVRKQSSLKCAIKAFDKMCVDLAKRYPNYRRSDDTPDKAHMLYTLYACGFTVLTDANLEQAFEAAARHAAGLPTGPVAAPLSGSAAAADDSGVPF